MGIRTVMITGDNPLTAAAIAQEAGVDDFLAEATPEAKMALIKSEQEGGKLVAMTGDGTNDAPALAQADVGVAMNTGTTAAKEAGNMVDLDSNPTKLIDVVEIGKQLLITRGSLTTFSIANDVAKYFAIIPALFVATYPQLNTLNIMKLHSPQSAVLSAVIFNALVIVALIPLALRGRASSGPPSSAAILRRNVLIYGVGGIIVPVHLHQAHRPHPGRPPRLLMETSDARPPPPLGRHGRRSLIVFFGFVYAFAGTGVSQLFFKHQADGSITANGSTLIGQNWTQPQAWFHGRPDDTGPYAADPKKHVSGGDNPLVANGVSGESGATNLGPRSKVLLDNTKALVAYWHRWASNPTPDLVTTSGSGSTPTSPQPTPSSRSRWSPGPPASRRPPCARSSASRPTARSWASWASSYIDVLQLNEGLAKLKG